MNQNRSTLPSMRQIHHAKSVATAIAIVTACTLLYLALPLGSQAKTTAQLQQDITRKKAKEGVLTSDIHKMSSKIASLTGRIGKLQSRQNLIQGDLDKKVARQQQIVGDLTASRRRLATLKQKLAYSRKVLAHRIVAIYKAGDPNVLNVVLQSHGFAEMVERATYLKQIAVQDNRVITSVTVLKKKTGNETVRLASLEKEASQLVAQVKQRRDQVAAAKGEFASRKGQLDSVVGSRKATLASVSKSRKGDEEDLSAMQASSNTVGGILQNSNGPIKQGTGRFIYPVNGVFTSPFGYRWGKLHAGIDLAVPVGTPIHAADGGTVRYAGWMDGYGNYTCIQHSGTISTCYGHQSSISVRTGQSVKQGDVIGLAGNTGHSTGPHLHFEVRINGTPVDPMGYL